MKDRQLYDLALAVKAQCRQGDMDPADAANVIGRLIDAVQDLEDVAPDVEMTLEQAVAILNERRHQGADDWHRSAADLLARSDDAFDDLTHFEAIAVAEKYQRVAAPEAGETALRAAAIEAAEWLETRPDYTEGDAAVSSRLRAALADAAPAGDGWRETANELPPISRVVILWDTGAFRMGCRTEDGPWRVDGIRVPIPLEDVEWWHPLPALPSPPSPNAGAAEGLEVRDA